jgi:hypothetical protein
MDELEILFCTLILICGVLGTTLFLVVFWYKRFNPEGWLFIRARRDNVPILKLHELGGGKVHRILGQKEKKDYPWFETNFFGVQLDPAFSSRCIPERSIGGLEEYNYSTIHPLPLSSSNARAMCTIKQYVRDHFMELDFLCDYEVLCLLGAPRDHLEHDCQLYIDKYHPDIDSIDFEEGMSKEALEMLNPDAREQYISTHRNRSALELHRFVDLIKSIQDLTATLPLDCGPFSYSEAFQVVPHGFLSQDMHALIQLVKRLALKENDTQYIKWMAFGVMVLLILVGGAIAYVMITGNHGGITIPPIKMP